MTSRLPAGLTRWLGPARWLAAAAVATAAALAIADQSSTLHQALSDLRHLQWRWVHVAIYAEALSVVALGSVSVLVLRASGTRVSLGSMLGLALASNAIAATMPGGAAWAAAFTFGQLRRRGVARHLVIRMLVISTALAGSTLVTLLVLGVDLAGDAGPAAPFWPLALAAGGLAVVLGITAAAVALHKRQAIRARVLGWVTRGGARLTGEQPLVASPRKLLAALLAAALNWVMDGSCLVCAILAVGGHVPWPGLLVAYAVGQIAQSLPITPGGVGVVEGALSVLLVAYGMHASTALAAVLIYRVINFWVLVPIGWATAGGVLLLQRRDARLHATAAPTCT